MKIKNLLILLTFIPLIMNAQNFEKDVIKSLNKTTDDITITFIKHGSLAFEYKGETIYIDPVSAYADYSKMSKADYILITHDHYDHLDLKAIELLKKPSTKIIGNHKSIEQLKEGIALRNGDIKAFSESFIVLAVAAYNVTEGRLQFHPKGENNGYVIGFDGTKVYVAGDTEFIPEMESLKDRISIAFLPVNQPYTMTIEQAIKAAKTINPKILYPYHYGETELKTPIEKLAEGLKDTQIEVRIRKME
jgi:L-ascorbate metabolism protein UlaG (beta-lactamase superfamily)